MSNNDHYTKFVMQTIVLTLILAISLSACSQGPTVTETPESTTEAPPPVVSEPPYPGAVEELPVEVGAYPPPVAESAPLPAYPEPGDSQAPVAGTHFAIDAPLVEGATEISGAGPAGTPIQVVDISMNGTVLGSGVIGDDERFAIQLATPVEANRVIGIELSIPRDSETWVQLWELRGENARAIPNMGYYLDSVVTQPKSN